MKKIWGNHVYFSGETPELAGGIILGYKRPGWKTEVVILWKLL